MANNRGMALVLACLVVSVLGAYGSAMMVQSLTEHRSVRHYASLSDAFQLAESAADHAISNLQNGIEDNLDAVAVSKGSYWAEVEDLGGSRSRITSHGLAGQTQRDLEVVVQLDIVSPFLYSLFGEDSVTLKKDAFTDSYNSVDGDYDEATAGENGDVATNATATGSVTIAQHSTIKGQVVVGPGMADPSAAVTVIEPVTITATPDVASAPESLALPPIDTTGLECTESFTLPRNDTYTFTEGGSPYCFNSLSADVGSRVAVSGHVIVYANTVNFDKSLEVNVGGAPTQFLLGVYGSSDVMVDKAGTFVGALYAPGLRVRFKKDLILYGAIASEDIEIDKELELHYDEDLQNYSPTNNQDVTVVSWRDL